MRALIQRVAEARVEVKSEVIGEIGNGLLIFVCGMQNDSLHVAEKLAEKILKLRIFRDEDGRMNRSLADVEGGALIVSQFTLAADTSRGNRPGFSNAADPELGEQLYNEFRRAMLRKVNKIATGRFGAEMKVHLVNDGPVTIWMDTEA